MTTPIRRRQLKRLLPIWGLCCLVAALLLAGGKTAVFSQEPPPDLVEIVSVDDAEFPLVKVNLRTRNAQGGPVDLSRASFRENGIPVEYTLASAPAGLDLVFVLDANETMLTDDEGDGLSRYEQVAAGINQFAQTTLRPDLDRISIVVPDETLTNGRFLVQDEADPQAIQAALAAYQPAGNWPTPLANMMRLAVDHAGEIGQNGRYPAVLLFTDAGRIHLQLDYAALLAVAQANDVPIFGAILGTDVNPDEQARLDRLTQPTRGITVHAPAGTADAVYATWAQQAAQPQIQYQSLQRESGDYPLALNFNRQRVVGTLALTLLPPEIEVQPPETAVVRRGPAPDTPLADLEPKQVTVLVAVSWPDGKPRALTDLVWQVNGVRQPALNTIEPDSSGLLQLGWDIESLAEGRYEIVVDVADELGFTATSPTAAIDIETERPLPPTSTPAPTATPAPEPMTLLPADPMRWLGVIGVLGITAVVLLAINWWRTRRQEAATAAAEAPEKSDLPILPPAPGPTPLTTYDAFLDPINVPDMDAVHIDAADLIIGADEAEADLVLTDSSIARLHARITRQNDRYWLYDEGSAHGTYLNYMRLGLAPKPLTDGDVIGMGRLQFRFTLRPRDITDGEHA